MKRHQVCEGKSWCKTWLSRESPVAKDSLFTTSCENGTASCHIQSSSGCERRLPWIWSCWEDQLFNNLFSSHSYSCASWNVCCLRAVPSLFVSQQIITFSSLCAGWSLTTNCKIIFGRIVVVAWGDTGFGYSMHCTQLVSVLPCSTYAYGGSQSLNSIFALLSSSANCLYWTIHIVWIKHDSEAFAATACLETQRRQLKTVLLFHIIRKGSQSKIIIDDR